MQDTMMSVSLVAALASLAVITVVMTKLMVMPTLSTSVIMDFQQVLHIVVMVVQVCPQVLMIVAIKNTRKCAEKCYNNTPWG